MTAFVPVPDLKGLRETLCIAQAAIGDSPAGQAAVGGPLRHIAVLGELIAEIDKHRPLGPGGKHGDLHTATCGCEATQ